MNKDDNVYVPANAALFEAIYGKGLISLGGVTAIDRLFNNLNIKGLNVLDLGFGLGGAAFYLAQRYDMHVAGVEVEPWMVTFAEQNAPASISGQLKFAVYDANGVIPYADATFDIVYSKGVLNHVADKLPLFRQVHRVMKPGGRFVIADWTFPVYKIDGPLVCETIDTYTYVLQHAGFNDVQFSDESEAFLGYVKDLLANLEKQREFITNNFSAELYTIIRDQHQTMLADIEAKKKTAVRIIARISRE